MLQNQTMSVLSPASKENPWYGAVFSTFALLLLIYFFMVGIKLFGEGFELAGTGIRDQLFRATANPFVGLVLGIIATTLVQSSSATTTLLVVMVANGSLPLANAVPMVMGANIGTTVTNTLVSLTHLHNKDEFERAFSAATVHDFFNYLTVLILLPIEMMTGFLARSATAMAQFLVGNVTIGSDVKNTLGPAGVAIKAAEKQIISIIELFTTAQMVQAILLVALGAAIMFFALAMIVKLMKTMMLSTAERFISSSIRAHPLIAMSIGMVMTVLVQSSSLTTSLLVPLAGTGLVSVVEVFPVTLGANVGTTITGLLAAFSQTDIALRLGLTLGLVHFLFNVIGILLIYPFKPIRNIPIRAARALSALAVRSRPIAIAYIVGLFYGLPLLLIYLSNL